MTCRQSFQNTLLDPREFLSCFIYAILGNNTGEDAGDFVQKQFQKCVRRRQRFYNFKTTATNTNNIELVGRIRENSASQKFQVFGSSVAHILSEILKATGLQEQSLPQISICASLLSLIFPYILESFTLKFPIFRQITHILSIFVSGHEYLTGHGLPISTPRKAPRKLMEFPHIDRLRTMLKCRLEQTRLNLIQSAAQM